MERLPNREFAILTFILMILVIGFFVYQAQAQTPVYKTAFSTVQGEDGLWYIQCLAGCEEFYDIAPIDQLYHPQPTDWQAMNHFKSLEAAYLGIGFVPLPAPEE